MKTKMVLIIYKHADEKLAKKLKQSQL